jgi:hypothetical protein
MESIRVLDQSLQENGLSNSVNKLGMCIVAGLKASMPLLNTDETLPKPNNHACYYYVIRDYIILFF